MLCLVISLSLLAPLVVANDDELILACVELLNPEYSQKKCCANITGISEKGDCVKGSNEDMIEDCNYPRCLLKTHGLLEGDKIIDSKVIEMLDMHAEENPNNKAMSDRIKKQCLDGKYEAFPPKSACLPVKFFMCSYMNAIVECPNWRNEDDCNEMAEQAKKCKTFIDKDISFDF